MAADKPTRRLIAVPTAFNIYQVRDDVLQMNQAQSLQFPPIVVMETLVMQGMAKRVARIQTFDMDEDKDGELPPEEDQYESGPQQEPEGKLDGPWYQREEEEE